MKLRDLILLLTLGAIWGSSFLFLKVVVPVMGIYTTVALRLTMAAVVLVGILAYMKKLPDYKKFWKQYLLLGLLNLVIPFGLISYSINHLTSSTTAILNATTPLFALVIASVWLKETITVRKLSGILTAMAGLVILVGWMPVEITSDVAAAIALSLVAAVSYGTGTVYIKARVKEAEPVKTATGQVTAGAILSLPFLFTQDTTPHVDPEIITSVLALGLICTALAYVVFFQLIKTISSTNASLVTVLVPVFSMLWGVLFLNEPVTLPVLAGLLLIVFSLILVLNPGSKNETVPPSGNPATLRCYYCIN